MDLVTEIYSITSDFPDTEKYGLINQLRRASISIPSNIAEGTSRPSQKEFKHFLHIALGSSFEVTTQIELSYRLNFITEEIRTHLLDVNDLLQRKIQSFLKQLN